MAKQVKILGVIPARLHSKRLPGKMLADISGEALICRALRQVKKSHYLDEVIVATDSKMIVRAVEKCGGKPIITSKKHRSGTERVAEIAKIFKDYEIVINIQGDNPLVSPKTIDKIARALIEDKNIKMATIASPIKNEKELKKSSVVKTVVDKNSYAIYFSRSVVPFAKGPYKYYLKHHGIYGFRRGFLLQYSRWRPGPLELAEDLEQLRVLEHGYKIKVVIGKFDDIEVNTKEDLKLVRQIIKSR